MRGTQSKTIYKLLINPNFSLEKFARRAGSEKSSRDFSEKARVIPNFAKFGIKRPYIVMAQALQKFLHAKGRREFLQDCPIESFSHPDITTSKPALAKPALEGGCYKSKFGVVIKTIAIILVFAMLVQDIAWAYPDKAPSMQQNTLAIASAFNTLGNDIKLRAEIRFGFDTIVSKTVNPDVVNAYLHECLRDKMVTFSGIEKDDNSAKATLDITDYPGIKFAALYLPNKDIVIEANGRSITLEPSHPAPQTPPQTPPATPPAAPTSKTEKTEPSLAAILAETPQQSKLSTQNYTIDTKSGEIVKNDATTIIVMKGDISEVIVPQGGLVIVRNIEEKWRLSTYNIKTCSAIAFSGIDNDGGRVLALGHVVQRLGVPLRRTEETILKIVGILSQQGVKDIEVFALYDPSSVAKTTLPTIEELNVTLAPSGARVNSIEKRKGSDSPKAADLEWAKVTITGEGIEIVDTDIKGRETKRSKKWRTTQPPFSKPKDSRDKNGPTLYTEPLSVGFILMLVGIPISIVSLCLFVYYGWKLVSKKLTAPQTAPGGAWWRKATEPNDKSRRGFLRNLLLGAIGATMLPEGLPNKAQAVQKNDVIDLMTYPWQRQTYQDSQGITRVWFEGNILNMEADLVGQHPNKSRGEAFTDLGFSGVDLTDKKITMEVKVPPDFARNGINGAQIFAKTSNWKSQYSTWQNITRSGEWITLEYTPAFSNEAPPGYYTEAGFDPSNVRLVGIKFAINDLSTDTSTGIFEMKNGRITDVVSEEEPEWVPIYRDVPITVEPEDVREFVENSGASFYLSPYERTIGTSDGVSSRYNEILNEFKDLDVRNAKVWLMLGSKSASGIIYGTDGTPTGFRDQSLAVEDLVNLIRIAEKSKTKVALVLHNYDLAEDHRDVLEDSAKTDAMINLDRTLLTEAMAELGSDWDNWVEAIEIMNEPDNATMFSKKIINNKTRIIDVQRFVKRGIEMARETTGKPISMGAGSIENAGYWIHMLNAGDIFEIHWYNRYHEEPYGIPLFDELRKNIGIYNIPEGVRVVIGEAQPNIDEESIMGAAFDAARESGAEGIWFWKDNRPNPDFIIDTDYLKIVLDGRKYGLITSFVEYNSNDTPRRMIIEDNRYDKANWDTAIDARDLWEQGKRELGRELLFQRGVSFDWGRVEIRWNYNTEMAEISIPDEDIIIAPFNPEEPFEVARPYLSRAALPTPQTAPAIDNTKGGAWWRNATYMRYFAWWVEPIISYAAAVPAWLILLYNGNEIWAAPIAALAFWMGHIFAGRNRSNGSIYNRWFSSWFEPVLAVAVVSIIGVGLAYINDLAIALLLLLPTIMYFLKGNKSLFNLTVIFLTIGIAIAGIPLFTLGIWNLVTLILLAFSRIFHVLIDINAARELETTHPLRREERISVGALTTAASIVLVGYLFYSGLTLVGKGFSIKDALKLPAPIEYVESAPSPISVDNMPIHYSKGELDNVFNALCENPDLLYRRLAEIPRYEHLGFSRYFASLKPGTRHKVFNILYANLRRDLLTLEHADLIKKIITPNRFEMLNRQSDSIKHLFGEMARMLNRKEHLEVGELPEDPLAPQPIVSMTRKSAIENLQNIFKATISKYAHEGYKITLPSPDSVNVCETAELTGYYAHTLATGVSFLTNNQAARLLEWVIEKPYRVNDRELLDKAMELCRNQKDMTIDLYSVIATIGHYYKAITHEPDLRHGHQNLILGGAAARGSLSGTEYIRNHHDCMHLIWAIDPRGENAVDENGLPVIRWRPVDINGDDYIPHGEFNGVIWHRTGDILHRSWNFILTSYYAGLKSIEQIKSDYESYCDTHNVDTMLQLDKDVSFGGFIEAAHEFRDKYISFPYTPYLTLTYKYMAFLGLDEYGMIQFKPGSRSWSRNVFSHVKDTLNQLHANGFIVWLEQSPQIEVNTELRLRTIEGGRSLKSYYDENMAKWERAGKPSFKEWEAKNAKAFWNIFIAFEQIRELQNRYDGKEIVHLFPFERDEVIKAVQTGVLDAENFMQFGPFQKFCEILRGAESPELLHLFASHVESEIRYTVAKNSNTPKEDLIKLADDPDELVRFGAHSNKNTPEDVEKPENKEPSPGGAWWRNATYMRYFAWWVEPVISYAAAVPAWLILLYNGNEIWAAPIAALAFWAGHISAGKDKSNGSIYKRWFSFWLEPLFAVTAVSIIGILLAYINDLFPASLSLWLMYFFKKNKSLFNIPVMLLTVGTGIAGIPLFTSGPLTLTLALLSLLTISHVYTIIKAVKHMDIIHPLLLKDKLGIGMFSFVSIVVMAIYLFYSGLKLFSKGFSLEHALKLPAPIEYVIPISNPITIDKLPELWAKRELDGLFNELSKQPELLYGYLAAIPQNDHQEFARYFASLKPGTRHKVFNILYKHLRKDFLILENAKYAKRLLYNSTFNELHIQSERVEHLYATMAAMLNRITPLKEGELPEKSLAPQPIMGFSRDRTIRNINETLADIIREYTEKGYKINIPSAHSVNIFKVAGLIGRFEIFLGTEVSFLEEIQSGQLLKWVMECTNPKNPTAHRINDRELMDQAMRLCADEHNKTINLFNVIATIGHYYRSMGREPVMILGGPAVLGGESTEEFIRNRHDHMQLAWVLDPMVVNTVDENGLPTVGWDHSLSHEKGNIANDSPIRAIQYKTNNEFVQFWNFILTSYYAAAKSIDQIRSDATVEYQRQWIKGLDVMDLSLKEFIHFTRLRLGIKINASNVVHITLMYKYARLMELDELDITQIRLTDEVLGRSRNTAVYIGEHLHELQKNGFINLLYKAPILVPKSRMTLKVIEGGIPCESYYKDTVAEWHKLGKPSLMEWEKRDPKSFWKAFLDSTQFEFGIKYALVSDTEKILDAEVSNMFQLFDRYEAIDNVKKGFFDAENFIKYGPLEKYCREIASNTESKELIRLLASHPNSVYRREVAENPNLPEDIIKILSNDPDDVVRSIIKDRTKPTEKLTPTPGGAWWRNATYMRYFAWWVEPAISYAAAVPAWLILLYNGNEIWAAPIAALAFWAGHISADKDESDGSIYRRWFSFWFEPLLAVMAVSIIGAGLAYINDSLVSSASLWLTFFFRKNKGLFNIPVILLTVGTGIAGIPLFTLGPLATTAALLFLLTISHIYTIIKALKHVDTIRPLLRKDKLGIGIFSFASIIVLVIELFYGGLRLFSKGYSFEHALRLPAPIEYVAPLSNPITIDKLPEPWAKRELDGLFNELSKQPELLYGYLAAIPQTDHQEFARYFASLKPGTRQKVFNILYTNLRRNLLTLEQAGTIKRIITPDNFETLKAQSGNIRHLYASMACMLNRVNPVAAGELPDGPIAPEPIISLTRKESIENLQNMFKEAIRKYTDNGYRITLPSPDSVNMCETAELTGYFVRNLIDGTSFFRNNQSARLLQWVLEKPYRVNDAEMLDKAMQLCTNEEDKTTDLFSVIATIGHCYKSMAQKPILILGGPAARGGLSGTEYIGEHHDYMHLIWVVDPMARNTVDENGLPVIRWRLVDDEGNDYIPQGEFKGVIWHRTGDVLHRSWNFILTSYYAGLKSIDQIKSDYESYDKTHHTILGRYEDMSFDNFAFLVFEFIDIYIAPHHTPYLPSAYKYVSLLGLDEFGMVQFKRSPASWSRNVFSHIKDTLNGLKADGFIDWVDQSPTIETNKELHLTTIEGGRSLESYYNENIVKWENAGRPSFKEWEAKNAKEFWKTFTAFEQIRRLQTARLPFEAWKTRNVTEFWDIATALEQMIQPKDRYDGRETTFFFPFDTDEVMQAFQEGTMSNAADFIRFGPLGLLHAFTQIIHTANWPDLLHLLASHHDPSIRQDAAMNPNISVADLRKLLQDPNPQVRFIAQQNPNTPEDAKKTDQTFPTGGVEEETEKGQQHGDAQIDQRNVPINEILKRPEYNHQLPFFAFVFGIIGTFKEPIRKLIGKVRNIKFSNLIFKTTRQLSRFFLGLDITKTYRGIEISLDYKNRYNGPIWAVILLVIATMLRIYGYRDIGRPIYLISGVLAILGFSVSILARAEYIAVTHDMSRRQKKKSVKELTDQEKLIRSLDGQIQQKERWFKSFAAASLSVLRKYEAEINSIRLQLQYVRVKRTRKHFEARIQAIEKRLKEMIEIEEEATAQLEINKVKACNILDAVIRDVQSANESGMIVNDTWIKGKVKQVIAAKSLLPLGLQEREGQFIPKFRRIDEQLAILRQRIDEFDKSQEKESSSQPFSVSGSSEAIGSKWNQNVNLNGSLRELHGICIVQFIPESSNVASTIDSIQEALSRDERLPQDLFIMVKNPHISLATIVPRQPSPVSAELVGTSIANFTNLTQAPETIANAVRVEGDGDVLKLSLEIDNKDNSNKWRKAAGDKREERAYHISIAWLRRALTSEEEKIVQEIFSRYSIPETIKQLSVSFDSPTLVNYHDLALNNMTILSPLPAKDIKAFPILEGLSTQDEQELKAAFKEEKDLSMDILKYLKNSPVNEMIDLSLIPRQKDGLTNEEADKELEQNIRTLARSIVWNSNFGLDVRYTLEDNTDEGYAAKALEILKSKLGKFNNIPGVSLDIDKLFTLHDAKGTSGIIEIQLKSIENIKLMGEIPDKTYPVALDIQREKPGYAIPNYMAAQAIGLAEAALRIAAEKTEGKNLKDKYDKVDDLFKRKIEESIRKIYERWDVDVKYFDRDLLKILITFSSAARKELIIKYALPPVVKENIENLYHYHRQMQILRQHA